MQRVDEQREEARATQIKANEAGQSAQVQVGGSNPRLFPIPVIVYTQAKNQLLNGDFSHSVCTWNDAPPPTGNRNEECAWWFSSDAPVLGQVLNSATA